MDTRSKIPNRRREPLDPAWLAVPALLLVLMLGGFLLAGALEDGPATSAPIAAASE